MDEFYRTIWTAITGEAIAPRALTIERPGCYLPATLRVHELMLSSVAASTTAAAQLDEARTGESPQQVSVDAEHIAIASRSERFAVDGKQHGDLFAPLSRFWRAADGWIRLHGNYPWHRDRTLEVLECKEDQKEIETAISRWPALELEDTLAAAGGLGYAVRTADEWGIHEHGRNLSNWPTVRRELAPRTLGRIRSLAPGRFAEGVRVLDLTRVIAGPVATRTLAAWGADVLRVDSPSMPELTAQLADTMPGKRSCLVDFNTESGLDTLHALLAEAHVLVHSYRPGALARFGVSSESLRVRHPHLTVVNISAWGDCGPWAKRRGFDSLVQAATGIARFEGTPDGPGTLPAQALDHATGYIAAAAAMVALSRPELGVHFHLSLAQTAHLLTSKGEATVIDGNSDDARALQNAGEHLVELHGADGVVTVVKPPGRVSGRAANWRSAGSYGKHRPVFSM